jgi:hypothetical protein
MAVNKCRDTVEMLEHDVLQVNVEYLAQYFFIRLGVQTNI